IDYIQKELKEAAEMAIELVELEVADATALADFLGDVFSRVSISVSGTFRTVLPRGPGGQFLEQLGNVVMFPYPRFNALLIAAPKLRMKEVLALIKKFDRESSNAARVTPFTLKRAQASQVGTLINNFYSSRYAPFETTQQNQIRVTWNDANNTVFVQ